MPRRRRNDGPGTIHHVMGRGVGRRSIFLDDSDCRFFLARLAWEVKRRVLVLHAFVLMTNHYHLLVESLTGELSAAMARIQNRHARRFNRRAGRDGPLFRDRFKSVPVEDDAYWNLLFLYIEGNPVASGVVSEPTEFRFSSAYYHGCRRHPRWLRPRAAAVREGRACLTTPEQDWVISRALTGKDRAAVSWPTSMNSAHVREWFLGRAVLADGQKNQSPAASPMGVMSVIEQLESHWGTWRVTPRRKSKSAWPVLRVGALRDLCCLSHREIAHYVDAASGTVDVYLKDHRRLSREDSRYARVCAEVAKAAVQRVMPL